MRAFPDALRRLLPRGVGTLAGANLISQLCTLAALPLLTRWCNPSDFGLLQVYISVTTIGGLVACLRYDYAVLQPDDHPTAGRLVGLSIIMALITGCVTLAIVPLLSWTIGTQGWHDLSGLTPVVGAAVALTGMSSAMTQWLVRQGSFKEVAQSRLFQNASMAALQLAGALSGAGGTGLILGDAAGRLIGLLILFGASGLVRHRPRSRAAFAELATIGRDYLRFPMVATPSALINAVGFSLPVFFLEKFYGTAALGLYSLLERVMGVPTLFVGQPLSQTFIYRLREAIPNGSAAVKAEIRATARLTGLFGLTPFIALAVAGPFLFVAVFGERWRSVGELAQMLSVVYFIAYVVWPVMPTLTVLNRLRTQMAWDAARALSLLGMVYVIGLRHVRLELAITMVAVLMAAFGVVHYGLCLNSTRRLCPPASAP